MSRNKNIFVYMGADSDYAESDLVIFGAPFDGTTTYRPGTRFAANDIRTESFGVEAYSPYMDLDLEDISFTDVGDIELPFGDTKAALEMIGEEARHILSDGKIPFMIGGEHLVSLPAIKAVHEKYEDLMVIHFDAHADLREDYMGQPLSHSTVMRRVHDFVGDGRIFQYGIRSGTRDEFAFAADGHTRMNRFNLRQLKDDIEYFSGRPVYVTIDLDVLDPSVFPGTGTPEPGGVSYGELQQALMLIRGLNVVGADVVELAPKIDSTGISTAAAVKTIRELILSIMG